MTDITGMRPHPRLRRLAIDTASTWVVNLLIALFITYLMPTGSSFPINLLFSMCIGTLAVWIIDGGRLLLWGEGRPSRAIFLLIAAAIPLAYYGGHALAVGLLGRPEHMAHAFVMHYSAGTLVITILACLFGTWVFWSRARLQQLEAQAAMEKARAAAVEKQALQAQLQLLQALIAFDTPRAQHMLEQLIQYLRATLSAVRAPATTLAQEFALLQAYLELMAIRMGRRLAYSFDLPDALRDTAVPPMLLQPLVENAIRHGVEPTIDGGRVDVTARRVDDMLELRIADTGLGLDAPSPQPGTSLGLANVRERLQALYGERATFSLLPNHPTGAVACLILPMTS